MPVKNGANYLKEALENIKKQNVNIEIILVDDGSIDDTSQIAESFGCKIIKNNTSTGQVIAKNIALKQATGDYVIFHDHDDVLTNNSLNRFLEEFKNDENIQVVNAKIVDFISPDSIDQNQKIKTVPYYGCLGGSIMFKKEVFDIIGTFNESIKAGEIIDITNRMNDSGINIKKIDFVSSNRRIHDTNFGKTNQKTEFTDYASILRAKLTAAKK
jgi:glycosyltransferase involved in cell wall biosynthesis